MAEVLAAELRADAELTGHLQDLLLQLHVPEPVTEFGTFAGQLVEVPCRGQLRDLEVVLGGHAPDDDREVVRRTGGRPQAPQLLVEEPREPLGVQHGLRLLVQERLVGAAAALGHEQELV